MLSSIRNRGVDFLNTKIKDKAKAFLANRQRRALANIYLNKEKRAIGSALVINASRGVHALIQGRLDQDHFINQHALFWEVAETVRILNENQYKVDVLDSSWDNRDIEWNKYDLILDERNYLMDVPIVAGQIKIFYCTGLRWDFHNEAELRRINWFKKRTGLQLMPQRFLLPNYSDQFADHILFYGNPEWMTLFDPKPQRHQLNISVTHVPEKVDKDYNKREFVWMGSAGAVHKGLDIAIEVFKCRPTYTLHIFGFIHADSRFYSWFKKVLEDYPNIIYHGHADVQSDSFKSIMKNVVGHIFPSASENGAGSVAQTSHFGVLPITTSTANTRTNKFGYITTAVEEEELIRDLSDAVDHIFSLPVNEYKYRSQDLIHFCRKVHTREAYSKDLQVFFHNVLGK